MIIVQGAETHGGQGSLTGLELTDRLHDVLFVGPILLLSRQDLFSPSRDLDGVGTFQAASPMLEGDARVAEVRILEGKHLVPGMGLGRDFRAVVAEVEADGERGEVGFDDGWQFRGGEEVASGKKL